MARSNEGSKETLAHGLPFQINGSFDVGVCQGTDITELFETHHLDFERVVKIIKARIEQFASRHADCVCVRSCACLTWIVYVCVAVQGGQGRVSSPTGASPLALHVRCGCSLTHFAAFSSNSVRLECSQPLSPSICVYDSALLYVSDGFYATLRKKVCSAQHHLFC